MNMGYRQFTHHRTRKLLITTSLLAILPFITKAQCTFDPTIEPPGIILCPDEEIVLTTQAYDSYQWFRNGDSIQGATGQTLAVNYYEYAGTHITVEATAMGCTEVSPSVLVDGWVFFSPFVINGGDYTFNGSVFEVCLNDTITFELGLPYNTNIQWTANGFPVDGATDPLLALTSPVETGVVNYNVCGSPDICPNIVQCLGVALNVQFIDCGTSGIEEPGSAFHIYPNPTNGIVHISGDPEMIGTTYILYDLAGKTLLSGIITSAITEIDIRRLTSGVYLLNLNGDERQTFKLFKQ